MHPPRHHTALWARRLAGTGTGQHKLRSARREYALDGQVGQMKNKNSKSPKIARPS
jgi:hypothetical protein